MARRTRALIPTQPELALIALRSVVAVVAVVGGAALVAAGPAPSAYAAGLSASCSAGTCSVTFPAVPSVQQWTVPAAVGEITAQVSGASGGSSAVSNSGRFTGGAGGSVTALIAVAAGQRLDVAVGGRGQDGGFPVSTAARGGYGGGGDADLDRSHSESGAGGGGGSFVSVASGSSAGWLVIAGGGGAAGDCARGGAGGAPGAGQDGRSSLPGNVDEGRGGTATGGGAGGGNVSPAQDGGGPASSPSGFGPGGSGQNPGHLAGAGGGGGYFGGGGAGLAQVGNQSCIGGAGGGSALIASGVHVLSSSTNIGDGVVVLRYRQPKRTATALIVMPQCQGNACDRFVLQARVVPHPPSGKVTFLDGATALGTVTVTAGGVARLAVALSVGRHALRARFGGVVGYRPSSSASTTVTVEAVMAPSASGLPATGIRLAPLMATALLSLLAGSVLVAGSRSGTS